MKKRTRSLVILLVILVLLIGVYAGVTLKKRADEKAASSETAEIRIGSVTEADTMSYYLEGELTSFSLDDGGSWVMDKDRDFPVNQGYITRIATAVSKLTAKREIEITEALSSYGLEEPANTLKISGGGSSLTLLIGKPSGDNYFAMEEGGDVIYTITSLIPGYLETKLLEMAKQDTMDPVSEDEATNITLSGGGREFTFLKVSKANGSATWYSEENGERGEQIAAYTPTGETELTASELLSKVLGTINSQSFTSVMKYKPDAQTLAACGLDAPALSAAVKYMKEQEDGSVQKRSYTLNVGAAIGDGTYFASLEGSHFIYSISEEDVKYLFTALDALGK